MSLSYIILLPFIFSYVYIGVVTYYTVLQICYWWVFHIVTISFTLKFPIVSRSVKKSKRVVVIHAIMVAVAILLPFATVIAAFSTGGFTHASAISPVCSPQNSNVTFYGIVLPVGIMLALGVPMIISTLWIVIKVVTLSLYI